MVVSDLNEGENSFRRLAENLPCMVYRVLIEDDNRMIFFNDMVQTMTSYSPEELKKGKVCSIDPIILPEDRLHVINVVKDAIENSVPFEVEYRINNKSGEIKWFSEHGRPIRGYNGNPSYIDGVIFDITYRKEAEKKLKTSEESLERLSKELERKLDEGKIGLRESEKKFKSVFDDSPIGIELYNSNGKLVDMNKSCLDIFGISRVADVADFNLFDDPNVPKEQLKKLKKGQIVRHEIIFDFDLVKDLNLYETTKSGKIWIDVLISPLYLEENNTISNYLIQLQDITERKITEQKLKVLNKELDNRVHERTKELKESEEKYRLITENVDGLISVSDQNMNFEYVNEKAYFNILGRSKEEIIGKTPLSWVHPEDAEKIIEEFKNGFEKGKGSVEARFKDKKGIYHWFDIKGKAFIDQDGKKKVLTISRDTTHHKQAEQIIVQEREKANLYLNVVEIILVALDVDGNITLLNKKGHELLGYDEGELIGKNWFEVCLPPNDRERVHEYFKKLMAGEMELIKFYENPIWSKTGEERLISWSAVLFKDEDGYVTGLLASGVDITERAITEQKLIESEASYKHLSNELEDILDHIPGIVVYKDTENNILRVNKFLADAHNLKKADMEGHSSFDLYPKDLAQAYWEDDLEVINSKKPKINIIEPWETDAGKRWVNTSKIPNIDENGTVKGIIALAFDITERKKIEEELRENEKLLKNAQELAHIGHWKLDPSTLEVTGSDELFKIFGLTHDEATLEQFAEVVHPEDREVNLFHIRRGMEKGESWDIEHRLNSKDDKEKWVHALGEAIKDDDGKIIMLMCTVQDITESKKAEQKLTESEEKLRKQNVFLNNLLKSLTHPFYVIDVKDYKVVLANSAASSEGLEDGQYCYSLTHNTNKPCEVPCVCPLDEVKRTKKTCVVEHIHYDEEGNEKTYEIFGYPILDENGNVVQMIEYALNVSDRKIAQQELKKSEKRYRLLFESSPIGIGLSDREGNVLAMNQKMVEMTGFTLDEFNKMNHKDHYVDINDRIRLLSKLKDVGIVHNYELKLKKKDGTIYDASVNITSLSIGEKEIFLTNQENISERKKTEFALRESEGRFRNLIEQSVDGITIVNENGLIIEWNKSQEQIIGLKREEVLGKPIWDIQFQAIPEREKSLGQYERFKGMIEDVLKSGEAPWIGKLRDLNVLRADNNENRIIRQLPFLIKTQDKIMLCSFSRDITEQKRIQEENQEKQATLESIFKASPIGIGMVKNRVLTKVNDRFCKIVGYTQDELLNKSARMVYLSDEEYENVGKAKYDQINKFGIGTVETKFLRKDGIIIDVLISSVPMDLNNYSVGVTFTTLEITERKKAEQKLIESEEKFRTIAERTLMGILIIQDNQVKYANEALLNLFEFSQEEILNWTMDDLTNLIHPEDLPFLREYREHLRSGETGLKPYYSYRVFTKLEKIKWIDQFSKNIQYKGRSAELVTIIDVTEKKEVEKELIKLNHMKSELLRRMSHELKTPLVSIKGFSDLLLELHRDKLDEYVVRTIEQIRSGCYRLESLVNDILKTSELESGTVGIKKSKEDLSLLIRICVSDLEGLIKLRNHTLNLEISDNLICSFEKKQIYNVITNILSNAIKYTPFSGKIEVKSEITNDFIIISIRDNGIGFSEEDIAHIFKKFGKIERYGQGYDIISEGSGLGLYISKKIIEMHGGGIWLESEGRDRGSTIFFSLPVV